MKSPEEIKKGLNCCDEQMSCDECPYHGENDCSYLIIKDGLSYIKQLEAERDALIYDIEEYCAECALCKYYSQGPYETPCNNCRHMHTDAVVSMWEWRGVQKEE